MIPEIQGRSPRKSGYTPWIQQACRPAGAWQKMEGERRLKEMEALKKEIAENVSMLQKRQSQGSTIRSNGWNYLEKKNSAPRNFVSQKTNGNGMTQIQCYRCRQKGHIAPECRQQTPCMVPICHSKRSHWEWKLEAAAAGAQSAASQLTSGDQAWVSVLVS